MQQNPDRSSGRRRSHSLHSFIKKCVTKIPLLEVRIPIRDRRQTDFLLLCLFHFDLKLWRDNEKQRSEINEWYRYSFYRFIARFEKMFGVTRRRE